MTLATPAMAAAALAAASAPLPATSTWTSPPHWAAAVTVLRVAGLMLALSCSATTSDASAVMSINSLDDFGFVLELVHQGGHVGHLDAGAALGRLADLECLDARLDVDAKLFWLDVVELLFLGLHDVGQGDVARLVEAQVGGDDGGQREREGFQAAVDFARDLGGAAFDFDLGGEGGLGPAQQRGQHLAGLVAVVVSRLLAEDDELGLFFFDQLLQQL